MTPKLLSARYVSEYRIHVAFEGGCEGTIDLQRELWGPVFEPLKQVAKFKRFRLNEELNTIEWPETGADLAPEFLFESAQRRQSAA